MAALLKMRRLVETMETTAMFVGHPGAGDPTESATTSSEHAVRGLRDALEAYDIAARRCMVSTEPQQNGLAMMRL